MLSSERDLRLKRLYYLGTTRRDAMADLGITNTNSMSSTSSRLGLHWSWPLANRTSGVAPPEKAVQKRAREKRDAKLATPHKRKTVGVLESLAEQNFKAGGLAWEKGGDHPVSRGAFEKAIDNIRPVELKGPVLPLHLSPAFPTPEESGLTASELFALAQMYTRDFGAAQAA